MSIARRELENYIGQLLVVERFRDYAPNGLQVEGRERISRIVTGVTTSLALVEAAIERDADALLVHHGWFWRGEDGCITGLRRRRLGTLIANDINLFAYHLPLDAHPELGNNAQLGQVLGWQFDQRFGEQELGCVAPVEFADAPTLAHWVQQRLGRGVTCVPGTPGRPIRRVAWCSGGAQGYFESAMAAGADAFITGEISEPQAHLARECGVAFLAAGHHATERYGAPAVAAHLAATLGLEHQFIDVDNPA